MFIRNRIAPFFILLFALATLGLQTNAAAFTPPASSHAIYDFNPDWKFFKGDVPGAEQTAFDDSKWTDISTPHTWNATDTYDELISHSGGERHEYTGIGWYRKHFRLPAGANDGKVFLEFEGLRQAARFWVNGKFAGLYENGVTPIGLDITSFVHFGDADNVIAVKVDNSDHYKEQATGAEYEWEGRAFNPNYGGLNHDIRLILTGKVYQTLPLYENLKTTGIYVYPSDFSIGNRTCNINIESQVRNESGDPQSITLSAVLVDTNGNIRAQMQGDTSDLTNDGTEVLKASGLLTNADFWSDEYPNLYDVYCILTVNGNVVDVQKVTTGFRKTAFRGGIGTGGVYLNDRFVWLTGYAQRSSDDWAGLGEAYPDWMHDYNANLIKNTHANYIRWMHISPQAVDVRACDKAGIIEICPAGDKEKDVQGAQWDQRMAVMRDSMIYFRNDPSILFWEAGNSVITAAQMQQMVDLRKQWDPNGGRVVGVRDNDETNLNIAVTPIAEYYGVMIGQDKRTDNICKPGQIFRGYSVERRDRAPLIEAEDFRDEAARRFWDDNSPPHFGFKPGPDDTYHWTSETFCLAAAVRYHDYVMNCITNTDPAHSKWSGYASIFWSDSNADGRQDSSEVARVSGKVDSVRLPKQAYDVYRVMQNPAPDIHIIGHWTYPAGTVKTVYVAANHCDSIELFVNGKSLGTTNKPCDFVDKFNGKSNDLGDTGYIYAFPDVKFTPGVIRAEGEISPNNSRIEPLNQSSLSSLPAVGGQFPLSQRERAGVRENDSNDDPLPIYEKVGSKVVITDQIETAGKPKAIKLTVHTAPDGLKADGSDVAFVDFEVVDAHGRRCPTDEARVDFKLTGPAVWRGGYNSGLTNSINNLYLDTECGINRVAIRSTLQSGTITLTATRPGLEPGTVQIQSQPVKIIDGLAAMPVQ
jgi:beta-galactosidase